MSDLSLRSQRPKPLRSLEACTPKPTYPNPNVQNPNPLEIIIIVAFTTICIGLVLNEIFNLISTNNNLRRSNAILQEQVDKRDQIVTDQTARMMQIEMDRRVRAERAGRGGATSGGRGTGIFGAERRPFSPGTNGLFGPTNVSEPTNGVFGPTRRRRFARVGDIGVTY